MRRISFLTLMLLSFAGCGRKTGSVHGIVRFEGEIPKPREIKISPDRLSGCAADTRVVDDLRIDEGTRGVPDVVVRIMNVKAETAPEKKDVVLSMSGCKFTPSVVILSPGSNLLIDNPERVAHNAHVIPLDGINPGYSRMMMLNLERSTLKGSRHFVEPELMMLQCDIHPWMKASVVVHDPRFAAITGFDGRFEIKAVPPGKYRVMVDHMGLGEREMELEIKAGEISELKASFAGKK